MERTWPRIRAQVTELQKHPQTERDLDSPTRARMTVSRGAAGKAMVMFISNICRRSTVGGERESEQT